MPDSDNVRVAVTGAVRYAPLGTTAPTSATTTFGAGWVNLGYISEDGITETPTAEWSEIRAWQNSDVVRRSLSSHDITWQFTLIETTQEGLELYHPGSTITGTSGASKLEVVPPAETFAAMAFDVIDGNTHTRIVVPKAEVVERGAIVYNGTDPIGYGITVAARDSGLLTAADEPIYAYKYSDDPAWAAFGSA